MWNSTTSIAVTTVQEQMHMQIPQNKGDWLGSRGLGKTIEINNQLQIVTYSTV